MAASRAQRSSSVEPILDGLAADAASRGVPEDLIIAATTATYRHMEHERFFSEVHRDRRVSAYFWGVVRRQAFRGPRVSEHQSLRQRLIAASIAEDMRASGIAKDIIRGEVARSYGEELAAAVVDRMSSLAVSA